MSNSELLVFPQEIIDKIVDEISSLGSKKLLSLVALSARCFLHPAQSYIFRTIDLTRAKPEVWKTFCAILHHSPAIKFHVRKIFFGNIYSDPCEHVDIGFAEPAICKFAELNSTISLFTSLQALHFNFDGQDHRDDWRRVLIECPRTLVTPFWCQPSITTLSLSSLRNVAIGFMNSILKLSQLTTLMIENVEFVKDAPFVQGTFHLINLETFGLIFDLITTPNVKKLGDYIIRSASRKLRKIMVSESVLGNATLEKLPKLKTLSAYGSGSSYGSYPIRIRPILLKIIESPLRSMKILELIGMEHYISDFSGRSIEAERILWLDFDSILQDPAFSRLKEIRLLFNWRRCPSTWDSDHSAETCESLSCRYCSIEQVASELRSTLQQTSERGVQVTYDLTYGREGLLSTR